MLGEIIAVIIGVTFIYTLLGIIVMEVDSLLIRVTRFRTQNLRLGLDKMLEDPIIRAKIYTHPLIQLVQQPPVFRSTNITVEESQKVVVGQVTDVDWIDSSTFVEVLLSIVAVQSDQKLYGALYAIVEGIPSDKERQNLTQLIDHVVETGEGIDALRAGIEGVEEESFNIALMQNLENIEREIGELRVGTISTLNVIAGVQQLKNPHLQNTLSTTLGNADHLDIIIVKMQRWFENGMSQTSVQFATLVGRITLTVAFIIAVILNIDLLQVSKTLWDYPFTTQLIELVIEDRADNVAETATPPEDLDASMAQLTDATNLHSPIGWVYQDVSDLEPDHPARLSTNNLWNYFPQNNLDNWLVLLMNKIVGLTLTIIITSNSTPFLFNLRSKLMYR